LAYALPRGKNDKQPRVIVRDEFLLFDEPLHSPESFLDFDGVVTFAGAYETVKKDALSRHIVCVAPADLDLREREFYTGVEKGKTFVFLLPKIDRYIDGRQIDPQCDLFRRFARRWGLTWDAIPTPCSDIQSTIPEFRDFISRYGTGYVGLRYQTEFKESMKPICSASGVVLGLVIVGRVFLLPCTKPDTDKLAMEMSAVAIEAAVAYRRRISTEIPEWAAQFAFTEETALREKAGDLHSQIARIEGRIDGYVSCKGALCYRSDPLVEVVGKMLDHFFGISLTIDDKCVEDATLQDDEGTVQAVFEIKGVKGNFTRANVNQVDSHRERLRLPATTPGILIMNTLMGANSLEEKDQPPHPDIIQKAVNDRVLLIRTLDLLRYADAVEQGELTKEGFRRTILTESGWLKVENTAVEIVKQ